MEKRETMSGRSVRPLLRTAVTLGLLAFAAPAAQAEIVWHWFIPSGFEGTITTSGSLPAVSGVYDVTDFEITATPDPVNFPLGSVSGGQYIEGSVLFALPAAPAEFTWDATTNQVTAFGTIGPPGDPRYGEFYSATDSNDRILFGASDAPPETPLSMAFFPNNATASLDGLHGLTPGCPADSTIQWRWSIPGFEGILTTPGCLPPSSRIYPITDFELTATSDPVNFPLGSVTRLA